jgi:hypothetical protein
VGGKGNRFPAAPAAEAEDYIEFSAAAKEKSLPGKN